MIMKKTNIKINFHYNIMEIYQLIEKLFPICRSITGNGVRETLNIIKRIIPINVKEIASGTEINTWKIPKEWNINDAYILDKNKEKIIDFKKNNLHVVNYSIPVNRIITFKELEKNLYYLKDKPNTIPYMTSYYKERWGFCITYDLYLKLKENGDDEEYHIVIDSSLTNGSLTYADLLIPGIVKKEILISTYCCHPSMCHDNLSGLCLTTYIAKALISNINYYSYRFVFIPETIGSIVYINENYTDLKENVIGGYVVTHVGDNGKFKYIQTIEKNNFIDKLTIYTLNNMKIDYELRDYNTYGSDERNYNFPNVDLNVGSIVRSKYTEYPEYHTSDDNLNFVSPISLQESFEIYMKCIRNIENNKIYKQNFFGEPFLSSFNLINKLSGQSYKTNDNSNTIKKILYLVNGKNDLITICEKLSMSLEEIIEYTNILVGKKIIYII